MVDLGYDFVKTLKILYSNYTRSEITVHDLDILVKKSVITENQAILIWETLLNVKTERNLDWWGYNKFVQIKKNFSTWNLFEIEMNFHFIFVYVLFFLYYIIYIIAKRVPNLSFCLNFFIFITYFYYSYYFYSRKYYFTSFICFFSLISNFYLSILSVCSLCGKTDYEYSILFHTSFKTDEHFVIKLFINIVLLIISAYFSLNSLRYYLNYFLAFYLLNNTKNLLNLYFYSIIHEQFQPFTHFLSIVFGSINFIFSQIFYISNLNVGFDINSYLFFSNCLTFFYITGLNTFLKFYSYDLGRIYLESIKILNSNAGKLKDDFDQNDYIFVNRKLRMYKIDRKFVLWIVLWILMMFFIIVGSNYNLYFYMILSIYMFKIINNYVLVFMNMKISRILGNFFLFLYLIALNKIESNNDYFINEIFAIYDQKFMMAIKLLIKLILMIFLFISIYFSEEFFDYFRPDNYLNYILDYTQAKDETLDYFNEIFVLKSQHVENVRLNLNYIYLALDYMTTTGNLWIISYIFSTNKNIIFFFVYAIHRVFIFIKLFLMLPEYTSTNTEKLTMLFLNLVYSLRMVNFVDADIIDRLLFTLLNLVSLSLYFFVYDDNIYFNVFLTTYSIIYASFNQSYIFFATILGLIIAKIISKYSPNNKVVFFIFLQLLVHFIFSLFTFHQLEYLFNFWKNLVHSIFNFKLIDIFYDFCLRPSTFEFDFAGGMYNLVKKLF
jgi:hypothetical protein